MLVLTPAFPDRRSLGTMQTQFELNSNKSRSTWLANHIPPQLCRVCGKSSWTTTSPNASGGSCILRFSTLWLFHTFNICVSSNETKLILPQPSTFIMNLWIPMKVMVLFYIINFNWNDQSKSAETFTLSGIEGIVTHAPFVVNDVIRNLTFDCLI